MSKDGLKWGSGVKPKLSGVFQREVYAMAGQARHKLKAYKNLGKLVERMETLTASPGVKPPVKPGAKLK